MVAIQLKTSSFWSDLTLILDLVLRRCMG